ncbi:MAG: taxon MazF [Omnitrophica bacterium RIFCSPLOWO2_01_FULL_45_10b]|nr:MAG: taxon MazF [Omnitrophica bacterium RIFCSPLOWO2_01_FULL_45_10b]
MEIKKWNVYLANLSPQFGTEPGKLRPVVVIQTNLLNEAGHPSTLVCPTTTKTLPKTKWLRVHLEQNEAGLNEKSDILVDQIRAIDNRRFQKRLGILGRASQLCLIGSLKVVFDF